MNNFKGRARRRRRRLTERPSERCARAREEEINTADEKEEPVEEPAEESAEEPVEEPVEEAVAGK